MDDDDVKTKNINRNSPLISTGSAWMRVMRMEYQKQKPPQAINQRPLNQYKLDLLAELDPTISQLKSPFELILRHTNMIQSSSANFLEVISCLNFCLVTGW